MMAHAGCERRTAGSRSLASWIFSKHCVVLSGMAASWRRDGLRSYRRRVFHSRQPLWRGCAGRDHLADALCRLCQHHLLALERFSGQSSRLARDLLHLCRNTDCCRSSHFTADITPRLLNVIDCPGYRRALGWQLRPRRAAHFFSFGGSAHPERGYSLDGWRSPLAAAASSWPRTFGGGRARCYCWSFAGRRPTCGDVNRTTLPSNLDDDFLGRPGGGGNSAVVCGFSGLFRRDRALWCREWPRICGARYFGARVIRIAPVFAADGAPCAAYFNVNGALSIPRRDCFSSRRRELNSWTHCVPCNCKRVARRRTVDASSKALRGRTVLLRHCMYSLALNNR